MEKVQIKTLFNGWQIVDKATALEFARHIYNCESGLSDKVNYINNEKLRGIRFTEEQLIEK